MLIEHTGVKSWPRKVDNFSYNLILIPIHLNAQWIMATIIKKIYYILIYCMKTILVALLIFENNALCDVNKGTFYCKSQHEKTMRRMQTRTFCLKTVGGPPVTYARELSIVKS